MSDAFALSVEDLIRRAPAEWLGSVCEVLRACPTTAIAGQVVQRLPVTNNADLAFSIREVVRHAVGRLSWEALGWTLSTAATVYRRARAEQHIELLWAGPSPDDQIAARRIDQTLYDLISNAKREILLVTFAAAKIERLTTALLKAAQAGVKIRLILEFEQSSEGGLSFDALKAFPPKLVAVAEVYHWPVEKRERNQAGRPGKLHAKVAIIDDTGIVSSANLTDDAFNRNLEVGVLVSNVDFLKAAKGHFDALLAEGTLRRIALDIQKH